MTFEEVLSKYALPIVLMALIVMVLIGIIKIFTKVIPNKNANDEKKAKFSKIMSHMYVILVPLFSAGVVCAYHGIFHLDFSDWKLLLGNFSAVWSCTQLLYPIYRDLGGRALFVKVLSLFKGKSAKADEMIELIESVMVLTAAQKEAIKTKIEEK